MADTIHDLTDPARHVLNSIYRRRAEVKGAKDSFLFCRVLQEWMRDGTIEYVDVEGLWEPVRKEDL